MRPTVLDSIDSLERQNVVEASASALDIEQALEQIEQPLWVRRRSGGLQVGLVDPDRSDRDSPAYVPACRLEDLGDPGFRSDHGTRYGCMSGAMANGIGSVELVKAMGRQGFLGVFGAAGLPLDEVERAIDRIDRELDAETPRAFNLIHSPGESDMEGAVVDLYLRRRVRLVEASAFLNLTLPVVRYRATGVSCDATGRVIPANRVIAKVSRVEVATKFLSPPPAAMLAELVAQGRITAREAELAAQIPMADDITAEADSGGHTDNQPAIAQLPSLIALRDRLGAASPRINLVRVGAAGGISTPWAAAAAFAMGAAYIVTGSVNQACVEAGTSEAVRRMLAQARQADVAMAPAADMFEMGVKVQVLKRGTLFAMRAARLHELYRAHESLDQIPAAERANLEKTIFQAPLETIWRETQAYFADRDPGRIDRARSDPKRKMALVFRWYLGMSSQWANRGDPARVVDYQIWCGPAMAAFNDWVRGSDLEPIENRRAAVVATAILHGSAVLARAAMLRAQGVGLPPGVPRLRPVWTSPIENRRFLP